ncbi:hypothetical protein VNO77_12015 [Canavalia gladiata]|uniref:Uncharacterized protein n=1 Tax=Canavalia gladiata TaxID=3824 RepID=A0AAN9LVS8_CANGL
MGTAQIPRHITVLPAHAKGTGGLEATPLSALLNFQHSFALPSGNSIIIILTNAEGRERERERFLACYGTIPSD